LTVVDAGDERGGERPTTDVDGDEAGGAEPTRADGRGLRRRRDIRRRGRRRASGQSENEDQVQHVASEHSSVFDADGHAPTIAGRHWVRTTDDVKRNGRREVQRLLQPQIQ